MDSKSIAPQGSLSVFRSKLGELADMTRTLYALSRLAETHPECFHDYCRLAGGEPGQGDNRLDGILAAWPGRDIAGALQRSAEALLAELNQFPLADGSVLCAGPLLDNFRIVGGLYVTANQRDPATFRHCADQRSVDHWLDAVCESQVEYSEVMESLRERRMPVALLADES